GHDLGPSVSLEDLVELILRETNVPRLRLGSLDPPAVSARLLELMESEPRLCPHIHLSLQSPHSEVLRKMKRRYRQRDVDERLTALHELGERLGKSRGLAGGVFVGMDVITGFPGETPAIFQWTLDHLASLPWHRLHVFPYSEREGTAATRLPDAVPPQERKERVSALMALSTERLQHHCHRVSRSESTLQVIVEGPATRLSGIDGTPGLSGVTPNYLRVYANCDNPAELRGRRVSVRPVGVHTDHRAGDAAIIGRLAS
ncbi:MAG: hypothetical protein VX938_05300, partial [Myxococcota bacterium]|nr:hypothetical protein [Myxococcota bacterium]